MSPPDVSSPGSMESAARMFVSEMRRERRSYWAIMVFFFILLAIMFTYNLVALNTLSVDQRREEFRSRGEAAGALNAVLGDQNDAAFAQSAASRQAQEAQSIGNSSALRRALRNSPDTLVEEAERYAIGHLYGRSLNSSTAAVLTGALESKRLTPQQRALLNAALIDLGMPSTMSELNLRAALRDVEEQAQILIADPAYAAYGHAARTGYRFRQANSGDMYMDWNNGCKELVEEAEKALLSAPAVATRLNDSQAAGLNLHYWHGQCRRRNGEPAEALKDFQAMMKVVAAEDFPPSNPYKFQAFHGVVMASMALPPDTSLSDEQWNSQVQEAIDTLERAGQYRGSAGMTKSGEISSRGNIGILTLRKRSPDKYVEALEYTEKVDAVMPSTWNLVGRLVAARALQKEGAPAISDEALRVKYSKKALNEIVVDALAKLAYLPPDFPKAEFEKLLDQEHHETLALVGRCINKKIACFEAEVK